MTRRLLTAGGWPAARALPAVADVEPRNPLLPAQRDAHQCGARRGLSDFAHLTRTFHQMFGIPKTIMRVGGELYDIPAPFEIET